MVRTGRPVVERASPLKVLVGMARASRGIATQSAVLLSICFIQKIFARCISPLKTSAHTNDGPMPDKTIDLSTEECEGIMHRDHHLQLRRV